ncbi:helix-turn-helix domain-containing protein [Aminobacterium sp. EBM-42]|jgi:DNA-binding MarR family transcriptional regulator|uniref:helix-turn-helix domain-containing protein n=1 Tax=Aminobacterium sp. EBM-42 TaxID=1918503 RepID=UPI002579CB70|nr:helix-turn-helix domain-containing protein [Aminobacterium sp. EBM-42]
MAEPTLTDNRDFWWICLDICVMRDERLNLSAKGIYAVLCTFASTGNRTCFPKVATLAKTAGCSERTVYSALKDLEECGYIKRITRYDGRGMQTSSSYEIIGHKAKREAKEEPSPANIADPACKKRHTSPAKNDIPLTIATITKDTYSPTERETLPQETQNPEDAPSSMRETAKLLLLQTKRSGLREEEISALKDLAISHTPARVQKEITTAIKRFIKNKRSLAELDFCYIAESLKYQKSWNPKAQKRASPTEDLSDLDEGWS